MKKPVALDEMPLAQMDATQLQDRLNYFSRRAKHLHGTMLVRGDDGIQRCAPIASTLSAFFEKMAKGLTDPKSIAERNEFMAKVQKDPAARQQFCALRLETYNNYLLAQMHWISFYFQIVTLADEERPMVQNTFDKEIKCHYVGQDGTAKMQKVQKDDTEALLPLRVLTSPRMRYKVMDLYRGNIVDQAVKTLTIARDMTNKMEAECKALLDTAFGAFSFTGSRANWPYVANSYINTSNLPTTNDVAVTNANGFFDYAVLDEIVDYAARFNGVLTSAGEFRPTGRILVPSKHIRFFGTVGNTNQNTQPAAPQASKIEESLLESGWTGVRYRGIDWVFMPDPTLDPDENICYPEFSVKGGRVFLKPGMDKEVIRTGEDDHQLFQHNEEERWVSKVFAAYFNSAHRIHFARFDYSE